jgi:hypothetical protein
VDSKSKLVRKHKEGHFILIKGAIHPEGITTINLYAPNDGTYNLIKHIPIDIKTQIDPNTVVIEDFNTSLSQIGLPDKKN